jgi:hypothetical protein
LRRNSGFSGAESGEDDYPALEHEAATLQDDEDEDGTSGEKRVKGA